MLSRKGIPDVTGEMNRKTFQRLYDTTTFCANLTCNALLLLENRSSCQRWHRLGQSEGCLERRDRGRKEILASFWHDPRG